MTPSGAYSSGFSCLTSKPIYLQKNPNGQVSEGQEVSRGSSVLVIVAVSLVWVLLISVRPAATCGLCVWLGMVTSTHFLTLQERHIAVMAADSTARTQPLSTTL